MDFHIHYTTQILTDTLDNHFIDNAFYIIDDYFKVGAGLVPALARLGKVNRDRVFWFHATEGNKSPITAQDILLKLSQINLKRTDTIIAIGGGITLDIAAFCASIYKRGCDLCLVPSTLIGMIDAAIGGKTGVNFDGLKNQIGSFYPASKVIIDYTFLKTLPEKEMKNGYAELIKMMIISHRDFFTKSFDYISDNLSQYIKIAIETKLRICSEDITDKGLRQQLNLGHTFAHLFETITDFEISHGEAVAKGLLLALKYSCNKGLLSQVSYDKISLYIRQLCNDFHFSEVHKKRIEQDGVDILSADKKASKKMRLIVVDETSVDIIEINEIKKLIDFISSEVCLLMSVF